MNEVNLVYEPFETDLNTEFDSKGIQSCGKCGAKTFAKFGGLCYVCAKGPSNSFCFTEESIHKSARSKYVILVDTCCENDEFETLKLRLQEFLAKLQGFQISLVTIESSGHVLVHSKSETIRFSVESFKVTQNLKSFDTNYFIKQLNKIANSLWFEDVVSLQKIVSSLTPTGKLNEKRCKRSKRATGLAIFLASSNLENNVNGQLLSFLAGPCTKGPGKIVERDLKCHIRQFHHFNENKCELYKSSKVFYQKIKDHFESVTYSFFVSNLDQIGLTEMSPLFMDTISMYQFDSFTDDKFSQQLDLYYEDTMTRSISKLNLKFCHSSNIKCSFKNQTSWLFKNDGTEIKANFILNPRQISTLFTFQLYDYKPARVQFQLAYNFNGHRYCRVTNIEVTPNSDQFFGAIMKATAYKIMNNELNTVKKMSKYTDQTDTRFKKRFNEKRERLDLEYYYNFRRSSLIEQRNVSPDERCLLAHKIAYMPLKRCQLIVRPKIYQYADGSKLKPNATNALLTTTAAMAVDSGDFIALRYIENDSNTLLARQLITKIKERLQVYHIRPLYFETQPGKSKDRYLKSRLIPESAKTSKSISNTEDSPFDDLLTYLIS